MSQFLNIFSWWHNMQLAVRDTVQIATACATLPYRLGKMLKAGSLEGSLKWIESDAQLKPTIQLSTQWIVKIGEIFLLPRIIASKHTCLFNSLVIYYLLARARKQVTLHFGCRIDDDIHGHCWLSSSDVVLPKRYTKPRGVQEIVSRIYNNQNREILWQTSYSQIFATETASSVLREKKSSAPFPTRKIILNRKFL